MNDKSKKCLCNDCRWKYICNDDNPNGLCYEPLIKEGVDE